MLTVSEAAEQFLASDRIAVTGVSRSPGSHSANAVYTRLRDRGYHVFAVNPNADQVEGDRCYHHLADIPGGVDAVVAATGADHTEETIRECAELGITQVWMHRAFGEGSVCDHATVYGREHGMMVIDGGCPLMFGKPSDFGHRLLRAILTKTGKVPTAV